MKRKTLIITCIVIGIIALVAYLVGGYLAGWDIIGYMKSPTFLLISMIVLCAILCIIGVLFFRT